MSEYINKETGQTVRAIEWTGNNREEIVNFTCFEFRDIFVSNHSETLIDLRRLNSTDRWQMVAGDVLVAFKYELFIYKHSEFEAAYTKAPENTNAPKETSGKPLPSLLPMDILMKYVEPAYQEGLTKYSRESWRKGFPISALVDAAMRHLIKFFWKGEDIDPDSVTKKHHLAGVVFCALSILHTLEHHPELDDRGTLTTGANEGMNSVDAELATLRNLRDAVENTSTCPLIIDQDLPGMLDGISKHFASNYTLGED